MLLEKDPERFARLLGVWRNIIRHHIAASLPKPSGKRALIP
jgi:hypothetical protein